MLQLELNANLRHLWRANDGGWTFELPTGWAQGRAVFGGLTTAAAVALAYRELPGDLQLRTFNVQFLRPSSAGEVRGTFTVHRQGKGTTFAETRLSQGGAEVLIVNMVFVRPRQSKVDVTAPAPAPSADVETLADLPYIAGLTPEYTQHLGLRWASGALPFSGSNTASFSGYCRFRVPSGNAEGLVAQLDAWPCPSLSLVSGPAAASSAMWTGHIVQVPADGSGWFRFDYETVVGAGGLHTAVGRLYAPSGELCAFTEQLVAVFA